MSGGAEMRLPPGFRFHPTDEELVIHYLCRKCAAEPIAAPVIADVDLYKHDPWQLPGMAPHADREWYFFSPRDRKYPNGSRPNRAAGTGYWKATGADKPIGVPKPVGIKKALVFYTGKAPKGEKTDWIMHEYRLADADRSPRKRKSLRLDEWVLCRIYKKKGGSDNKHNNSGRKSACSASTASTAAVGATWSPQHMVKQEMQTTVPAQSAQLSDYVYLDNSDSVARLHQYWSCSKHDLAYEQEVQSRLSSTMPAGGGGASDSFKDDVLQDILMYIQRPF